MQQGARQVESRDEPLVLGGGATHAWLHVFLPGAGWVPYDPTNTLVGGPDLIRVAYTRKPEQTAPVSCSWTGAASDFAGMDVAVSVKRIGQPVEPALAASRRRSPCPLAGDRRWLPSSLVLLQVFSIELRLRDLRKKLPLPQLRTMLEPDAFS